MPVLITWQLQQTTLQLQKNRDPLGILCASFIRGIFMYPGSLFMDFMLLHESLLCCPPLVGLYGARHSNQDRK